MLPYEFFIGLRYTRAKRRNHFISFISAISTLGISLGVAALITVVSVMNGFEKELRDRILGMAAHVTISGYDGSLSNWNKVQSEIAPNTAILGSSPYIQAEAMITAQPRVSGAVVRGILPDLDKDVTDIYQHMEAGSLDDLKSGGYGIVMGTQLANELGVTLGDQVMIVTSQVNMTPMGALLRERRFTVVGLFDLGMYEYDRGTAFIHLNDAGKLFRMGNDVTGLRLKIRDMFDAPKVREKLIREFNREYWVSDWTQRHASFFKAVRTEKTVMFVILALIVAVAAFNIVSTLVMMVTDKEKDIAVLRTLGATTGSIMVTFIIQGVMLGVIGTLIGTVVGVTLALNLETLVPALENLLHVKFLAPDVYYISELPSELHWADVLNVALLSLGLSFLATLHPASRAARTSPAEALRYE